MRRAETLWICFFGKAPWLSRALPKPTAFCTSYSASFAPSGRGFDGINGNSGGDGGGGGKGDGAAEGGDSKPSVVRAGDGDASVLSSAVIILDVGLGLGPRNSHNRHGNVYCSFYSRLPFIPKNQTSGSPFVWLTHVIVAAVRKWKALAPDNPSSLYENRELDAGISTTGRLLYSNQFKCGLLNLNAVELLSMIANKGCHEISLLECSKVLDRVIYVEYALRDDDERGSGRNNNSPRRDFGRRGCSPYQRSPSPGFAGVDQVLITSVLEAQSMIGVMALHMTEPGVQNTQDT